MNEHSIVFNARTGHNHDGVNSAPISIADGLIELRHLSSQLLDYLNSYSSGGLTAIDNTGVQLATVPDLTFSVEVDPGDYVTGEEAWVTSALVKYLEIQMEDGDKCAITFYHDSSYANAKREFKAEDCSAGFLWEGVWAHTDDTGSNKVYYKIQNTGTETATFTVVMKSSTMAASSPGLGDLGEPIPSYVNDAVKQSTVLAIILFSLSGGSTNLFAQVFEQFMGVEPSEMTTSPTYADLLNFSSMISFITNLCVYARTFGIYVAINEVETFSGTDTVTVHLDTPATVVEGTGDDEHHVYDFTAPVFFQTQVEVTEGSATAYSYEFADDPRIFTASIVGSRGGTQDMFGYADNEDGVDIVVTVPGATAGEVRCSIAIKRLLSIEGILEELGAT